MRAIVTGAGGFLGRRIVDRLLASGAEVVAVDIEAPAVPQEERQPARLQAVAADIREPGVLDPHLDGGQTSVVHLASMVSAAAEEDWTGAVETNVGGLLNVLDSCRRAGTSPRLTFASSVAVFGGPAIEGVVGDTTRQTPLSTYGMTKAVGELLVDDATRRGIVDGRCARLPTVIIRPGAPNRAASGFASGMFREPLAGHDSVIPVALDTGIVVIGAATAVAGIVALHHLDGSALGSLRAVSLPGLAVTVAEMSDALGRVGGDHALARLRVEPDPAVEAVVASWPAQWDDARARRLGLPADDGLDGIVEAHLADQRPA